VLCDISALAFVWKFGYNFVLTHIIRSYWHGDIIEGAMGVSNFQMGHHRYVYPNNIVFI
jgi:hypothetical protein